MILTALQSNQNHIDSYSPFFLFFLFQFLVPCLISYLAPMWTAYSKLKGLSQFQLYFLFLSLMHIFFFSMFASHRSQRSRIFLTPITLLNPENTIKLTCNTTFKNIKSLYIDTKLASFGRKTYRSQFRSVYLFPNLLPWWSLSR